MRYQVLATDYDGTLATDGRVGPTSVEALERLRASGRRCVLVTGRILSDLRQVFPRLDLFDGVVAENGASLWRPGGEERLLASPPPGAFLDALHSRGVPSVAGRVVIASWEPHENQVLGAIRDLGLELEVVFNKGAVMVLPPGVNKRSGLEAALRELGLTLHEAVAIGDAENDHAMLAAAECGVAVANALDSLKQTADLVTEGVRGAGVEEIVRRLLADDLASARLPRHQVPLGEAGGEQVAVSPAGTRVLVAGPSGSGKTTAASGLLEQLMGCGYQVCLVDPEGDWEGFPGLTPLGSAERSPTIEEVTTLLASDPRASIAVSLLSLPLADRPRFLAQLWPRLQELRSRAGRPHWLALDEAHHLLPRAWQAAPSGLPADPGSLLLVTLSPDWLSPDVLRTVNVALAVGARPQTTLASFFAAAGLSAPRLDQTVGEGQALVWTGNDGAVRALRPMTPSAVHRRHRRKYASGDVHDKAFVFRGAQGKLHLRAQNLAVFLQLADGVDDETWLHHLQRGDYSRWFREAIKDPGLAEDAVEAERSAAGDAAASRQRIREAVERRYEA